MNDLSQKANGHRRSSRDVGDRFGNVPEPFLEMRRRGRCTPLGGSAAQLAGAVGGLSAGRGGSLDGTAEARRDALDGGIIQGNPPS